MAPVVFPTHKAELSVCCAPAPPGTFTFTSPAVSDPREGLLGLRSVCSQTHLFLYAENTARAFAEQPRCLRYREKADNCVQVGQQTRDSLHS